MVYKKVGLEDGSISLLVYHLLTYVSSYDENFNASVLVLIIELSREETAIYSCLEALLSFELK